MIRYIVLILPVLFLSSCMKDNSIFDKNVPVNINGWYYEDPVYFKVNVEEPSDTFDIFINVRHNREFQWRNLWVTIQTVLPGEDEETFSNKVNLKLESPKGESYGKCTGDVCYVQVPVQYNAIFPDSGIYSFTIEQSMRENPVRNIENIGLRIQKSTRTTS